MGNLIARRSSHIGTGLQYETSTITNCSDSSTDLFYTHCTPDTNGPVLSTLPLWHVTKASFFVLSLFLFRHFLSTALVHCPCLLALSLVLCTVPCPLYLVLWPLFFCTLSFVLFLCPFSLFYLSFVSSSLVLIFWSLSFGPWFCSLSFEPLV